MQEKSSIQVQKVPRYLTRRQLLTRTVLGFGGIVLAETSLYGYARSIEPGWVEITERHLTLPRLSPAFDGYRIAQISDIHMDTWMTLPRLTELVKTINASQVDFITLTGDYVTHNAAKYAPDLVSSLKQLQARDGIAAILGNHDHWTNRFVLYQVIKDAGLIDLNNDVVTITRDGHYLHIAGVDDIWENRQRLDLVLPKLKDTSCAILLAHEPDFADESAATGRFDLQLSGHSHGGQVRVLGVAVTPYLGRKYVCGQYQVGSMIHYTNRGVGMVPPHVRFNSRPELTIFTLSSPKR
jgi:predicted MPP superfamily phosphohydrolase